MKGIAIFPPPVLFFFINAGHHFMLFFLSFKFVKSYFFLGYHKQNIKSLLVISLSFSCRIA